MNISSLSSPRVLIKSIGYQQWEECVSYIQNYDSNKPPDKLLQHILTLDVNYCTNKLLLETQYLLSLCFIKYSLICSELDYFNNLVNSNILIVNSIENGIVKCKLNIQALITWLKQQINSALIPSLEPDLTIWVKMDLKFKSLPLIETDTHILAINKLFQLKSGRNINYLKYTNKLGSKQLFFCNTSYDAFSTGVNYYTYSEIEWNQLLAKWKAKKIFLNDFIVGVLLNNTITYYQAQSDQVYPLYIKQNYANKIKGLKNGTLVSYYLLYSWFKGFKIPDLSDNGLCTELSKYFLIFMASVYGAASNLNPKEQYYAKINYLESLSLTPNLQNSYLFNLPQKVIQYLTSEGCPFFRNNTYINRHFKLIKQIFTTNYTLKEAVVMLLNFMQENNLTSLYAFIRLPPVLEYGHLMAIVLIKQDDYYKVLLYDPNDERAYLSGKISNNEEGYSCLNKAIKQLYELRYKKNEIIIVLTCFTYKNSSIEYNAQNLEHQEISLLGNNINPSYWLSTALIYNRLDVIKYLISNYPQIKIDLHHFSYCNQPIRRYLINTYPKNKKLKDREYLSFPSLISGNFVLLNSQQES